MVCTETVWAAAAQDPKPRLLVVDEVWSDHAAPGGSGLHGERWRSGRSKHRLGLQFITQDVQDLLSEDTSRTITGHSGRALLQNAAFKLLLQQDAAAISTVGDAFDLPEDLQRWLLSCPRGDGLLLAKGHRFPVALAKSRTWRGLTTTTGTASAARAATRGSSKPPEASSNTMTGSRVFSLEINCRIPASSWETSHLSSVGRTATSTWALATSMPT